MEQQYQESLAIFWKKVTKTNLVYLSGIAKSDIPMGTKLVLFPQKNKKTANAPDYVLLESKPLPKTEIPEQPKQEIDTSTIF